MELDDGHRHIIAGLCASCTFLVVLFGLGLVWWGALIAGLVVYTGILLIVGRKTPPT